MVRAAPPATRRVSVPEMSRVPRPTGLAVIVAPTVFGVLSVAKMSEPAWRSRLVKPARPKLLTPPRTKPLVPVLTMLEVFVPVMLPVTIKPSGDRPPMANVWAVLPRSSAPVMVGVELKLLLVDVSVAGIVRAPYCRVLVAARVAACESVTLEPVIKAMVVPFGMPRPVTVWPLAMVVPVVVTVTEVPTVVVELRASALFTVGLVLANPPSLVKAKVPVTVLLPT